MWGDPGQRGNAQNYCGNNPVNRVDPMGDRFVWRGEYKGAGDKKARVQNLDYMTHKAPSVDKSGFKYVKEALENIEAALAEAVRLAENDLRTLGADPCDPDAQFGQGEAQNRLEAAREALENFRRLRDSQDVDIVIRRVKDKNRRGSKQKTLNNFDYGETGLVITWDTKEVRTDAEDKGTAKRDNWVGLAHEISHAIDKHVLGISWSEARGSGPAVPGLPRTEYNAVQFENLTRRGSGVVAPTPGSANIRDKAKAKGEKHETLPFRNAYTYEGTRHVFPDAHRLPLAPKRARR